MKISFTILGILGAWFLSVAKWVVILYAGAWVVAWAMSQVFVDKLPEMCSLLK